MSSQQMMKEALRAAARRFPEANAEELAEEATDIIAGWEEDAAHEREIFGEPEDTPCLQSADLWGTGEGRWHGVIG